MSELKMSDSIDSVDLKVRLNKYGYKYKFIKLSELVTDKKYEVNAFELVNINGQDKVSVVLDNKYKLILPDRYFKTISENIYEINDKEWSTLYLYYRYKKILDNGDSYHRIEFEGNSFDTTVIKVLKQLNAEDYDYRYIKLSDLNINDSYKISSFKKIDTKYGERVSALLDHRYMLLLPYRFVNSISELDIERYDGEMYMKYKGKKTLDNRKTIHLIEFE
ncbi:unnamed protein product [Macrosiphum euphorbiae]|uniref:Uncharacterized protein n=1 Tax=Macrosiphum euphorbiae TaxID=13131 RepID=A0AAV0X0S1_9HEMI|nr:unnamed protein product [Macrosiphum euphorbiae]